MAVWRVLIVEDDPQMRAFFAASVRRSGQLELVCSVGSVSEAKALLDDDGQTVHVLLTDLGLPDGSGLEVIRHARLRHPDCEALVISMFGDEDNVLASIEAGALGYIHKDAAPDDIARVSEQCTTLLDRRDGLEDAYALMRDALPMRLRETAYLLACEVAAADGDVMQEELQLLSSLRLGLDLELLVAGAIERAARARYQVL